MSSTEILHRIRTSISIRFPIPLPCYPKIHVAYQYIIRSFNLYYIHATNDQSEVLSRQAQFGQSTVVVTSFQVTKL